MAVSNNWLVNVSVSLNNTVIQPPNFNSCALVGVMSAVPSGWSNSLYQVYANLSSFNADFSAALATSKAAFNYAQAQRYQYLLNAGAAFFAQSPTPSLLTVFAMPPQTSATNYTTLFTSFTLANNNFYGFSICDYITANAYAYVIMTVVVSAAGAIIPAGTTLSTTGPVVTTYTAVNDFVLPASIAGETYLVPFYSGAATESHAPSTLSVSGSLAGITSSSNTAATVNSVPGYITGTLGMVDALTSLRSATNQKKLFADFKDFTQASLIQPVGSEDLTCFYHSLNFGNISPTTSVSASLSAAVLSKYFTSVFVGSNGLSIISSMQLAGQPTDPTVNTGNIGQPGVAGSSTNLIGWDNNVYPAFGSSNSGIGLIQYGFQSNSLHDNQIYLDQVVGADYVQFTVQAALVNLILQSLPSGIPYSDIGIQQIVNAFKAALNVAVAQNILQPFQNSAITATPYALVASTDITNRVYKDLSFTGKFLSRIQMIQVFINLSI